MRGHALGRCARTAGRPGQVTWCGATARHISGRSAEHCGRVRCFFLLFFGCSPPPYLCSLALRPRAGAPRQVRGYWGVGGDSDLVPPRRALA